jgi:glycerate kinase
MRVLITPDKLKGTLTAEAAAKAIARGWRKARPQDDLDLLPMSDGGDGFGAVISRQLGAHPQMIKTRDAAHRSCTARWWWEPKTKTGIVESANVIGLAMLPPKQFHPFDLDTSGLAAVLLAVAAQGARRCLIGIGGSATNDGGFGLARGLGWKFLNHNGHEIEQWTGLRELAEIVSPQTRKLFRELVVAVDVQNPLLGQRGATRIYGPQKGILSGDFAPAESALRRLARVSRSTFRNDLAPQPGAGAAGGLGFGLVAFAGGCLEPGFDLFARYAHLDRHLRSADLVITAEGAIDRSTLMGKGAGQVARRCRKMKIPCLGLAGVLTSAIGCRRLFTDAHALTELATLPQAKARPELWLERLTEKLARGGCKFRS